MQPCIFVLIDGLPARHAVHMGWLGAMCAAGRARHAVMDCELPPLSRPLYHCILAGQLPVDSGVAHNDVPRAAPGAPASIFHRAVAAGLVTAAAAYHWISELYNVAPWNPLEHRLTDDATLPVQHGLFYCEDEYPDSHVFLDAEALRRRHSPDFLLVHTMGVDYAGHCHGGDSAQCRQAARKVDMLLARCVPAWLAAGYAVMVASDHGMHADGMHNDLSADVRQVPLWIMGTDAPLPTRQTAWADTLCGVLGI